ncbi:tautomerase family protein [Pseudomonas aegrilactucae]|uniref:4-oxalocrotonate tautomerase n=1 Tax=Pseudomonas aegrilactucae TaxID=2854028 RepID=A0A9Q2XKK3_9PSED|nr:4-oxalocrotonate tautomerase [Pseudomonas aegrilactucae]MBV6288766.1 4-oxalocrotonate tautomerase [Pseudomonas aegrilactucae]
MPHIVIQLSGPRDTDLGRQAVSIVNRLTAEVLGKLPEVMATTVQYVADEDWFIAGQPLSALGGSAFHLDISITDETNTKAEKARFIGQVYAALAALRPDLHETSYVHLIDARAAAYGYGGRTQEWRHQQAGV